jgi:small-conductance mechanosensitive channel
MTELSTWLQGMSGVAPAAQGRLVHSVVVVVLLWLVRTVALQLVWRRTENVQSRYHWRKGTNYVAVLVGLLLVGRIWFAGVQSLATFAGLVTAGLAIALQDLVRSMAGWVFILWRRPFTVGDRIEIGGRAGDVIDIRLFKFSLMEIGNWVDADQSTGRVIHMSNSLILTDVIANYSQGFELIWNEIEVLLTFESDWQEAKRILTSVGEEHAAHLSAEAERRIREASKRFMIFYTKLAPAVYTSVRDCGVLLTLRYLIEPRKRRGSEQAIWEQILTEFAGRADIDFAYPTQRFYDNVVEGKPQARAKPLPLP